MAIDFNLNIQTEYIHDALWEDQNIQLGILRLDQIHPLVSGNKWFKLSENIKAAEKAGKNTLLTFGGAFSNHLIATAAAANALGYNSIAFVRGFHADPQSSATLKACQDLGMVLKTMSRADYNLKNDSGFLEKLKIQFPNAWIIPEGGNNEAGRLGIRAIASFLPQKIDSLAVPIGSGTTLSGLRNCLPNEVELLGFAGFKNGAYLFDEIQTMLNNPLANWQFNDAYHFGGFAKHTPELIEFMNSFYQSFNIPLDFVYTAKMMFGLFDLLKKKQIKEGTHLIAIHTGGLQGNHTIAPLLNW